MTKAKLGADNCWSCVGGLIVGISGRSADWCMLGTLSQFIVATNRCS